MRQPTLCTFADRYALENDLATGTVGQLKNAAKLLARFYGRCVPLDELSDDLVNRWLAQRKSDGRAPATIRGNRISVLTLWRAAHDRGLAVGPNRVRLIKVPERIPECWTHADLAALRVAASKLRGNFRHLALPRAQYFQALIAAKYDTALRLSDLLSIERSWIWPGGYLSIVQDKSGRTHRVQLRESTLAEIDELMGLMPRRLIWPQFAGRKYFYRHFRQLVKSAGLRGSSKWIRRSSASYVERDNPGMAWRHLGHASPGCDRAHYLNPAISYPPSPLPPAIGGA